MKKLLLSTVLAFGLANAANVNLNNLELEQSQSTPVLTTIGIGGISAENEGVVVKIAQENITTSFLPFGLNFYADVSNVGYQKYTLDTYITNHKKLSIWGGVGYEKFKYEDTTTFYATFPIKKIVKKEQLLLKYLGAVNSDKYKNICPFLELDVGTKSINLNAGALIALNKHITTEFRVWKRFIYDNSEWDDLKGLFTVNYTF